MSSPTLRHLPEQADIDRLIRQHDGAYTASPRDQWRREVIYFLMIDRFSASGGSAALAADEGTAGGGDTGTDTRTGSDEDRSKEPDSVTPPLPPNSVLTGWRWDLWAVSGRSRFQGGTIAGIAARLPYLKTLGVSVLWLSPPWKQRVRGVDDNLGDVGTDDPYFTVRSDEVKAGVDPNFQPDCLCRDDLHGYAVQDFLDIDPRFGTVDDLVALVRAAHAEQIRVILDVQINHTGVNFAYAAPGISDIRPPYQEPVPVDQPKLDPLNPPYPHGALPDGRYPFGSWLDVTNRPMGDRPPDGPDEGVWPAELQNPEWYSRQGEGSYGRGDFDEQKHSEFRVSDYRNRDLRYDADHPDSDPVLSAMLRIWTWWMARTDCDGFRVDAIKHVPAATAAAFAQQIRTFARDRLGKQDFLFVGECGGSDAQAATYLQYEDIRVLSIDGRRRTLRALAGGDPTASLSSVLRPDPGNLSGKKDLSPEDKKIVAGLSPAVVRDRVVCSVDDHDGLGTATGHRLAAESGPDSIVPAVTLLLFGAGVPCLYYGTEQALAGLPTSTAERAWLVDRGLVNGAQGGDRYLREAMFGPAGPRPAGAAGRDDLTAVDNRLPGFGPLVTGGRSAFGSSPWSRAVKTLVDVRATDPVFAVGDIVTIDLGQLGQGPAGSALPAGVLAWARMTPDAVAVIVTWGTSGATPDPDPAQGLLALELPDGVRSFSFTLRARALARPGPDPTTTGQATPVRRLPQSGLSMLDVGFLVPGEARVYLGRRPGPTAAGVPTC
jgi:glycosidase